ncbi:hypothetical protein [Bradyrhizobium japonicum]|uniref:hypothetical protein n=1 Tax=Bradyrhizobium japonicum TaxID=375 RepID=UPI0004B02754|nr:hypothetical protein [Bradyrhizobium japonicum]
MKIFWSWLSDYDPKISHYFVRDALKAAIKKLKQAEDVEEPSEADRRVNLELDHDTKGLSGMPDIAASIFAKIDASAAFVADLTPIATSPSKKDKDGNEVGLRLVMNPNVAIELGYALKSRGWERCIGVLNLAYGSVDTLPFDIQQKRWPFTYNLPEGASKEDIKAASEKLTNALVEGLRPFLKQETAGAAPKFEETVPIRPPAFWFEKDQPLGKRRDNSQPVMPFEKVFYLKLSPTKNLRKLLSHAVLNQTASRYASFSLGGNYSWLANEWGAAMSEAAGHTNNVDNVAQHFHNGEIWGLNADILRHGESGQYQYLLIDQIERLYRRSLPYYIDCMTREYGVEAPIKMVAGAVGVKGRRIAWSGGPGNGIATMIKDAVEHEALLNVIEQGAIDKFLLRFFEKIFEAAGETRPENFGGFPP